MADTVVIDGKGIAAPLQERVRHDVGELRRRGVTPGLATIIVGDEAASRIYVRRKGEACAQVGIASSHHELAADTSQPELADLLAELGADDSVSGILLQLPLPPQIDGVQMSAAIAPLKDVDGLNPVNAGLLAQGRESDALVPCTPAGVIELLAAAQTELRGARAVVVGRSNLVGKPLAALLLARDATVTQCHSRTGDLGAACREADVLIAAVGVARLIDGPMVRDGATVIDVGMNRTAEGLAGDVDFASVERKARAITPVPGGVGPMTIAMLLVNTVKATRLQLAAAAARGQ